MRRLRLKLCTSKGAAELIIIIATKKSLLLQMVEFAISIGVGVGGGGLASRYSGLWQAGTAREQFFMSNYGNKSQETSGDAPTRLTRLLTGCEHVSVSQNF
jgi:hypothetical protein